MSLHLDAPVLGENAESEGDAFGTHVSLALPTPHPVGVERNAASAAPCTSAVPVVSAWIPLLVSCVLMA